MRVDDLMREGLSQSEARAQALREFGDRTRGAHVCAREGLNVERQRIVARLASELWQDASFGARLLRRSPGFSLVAILTLALAIGGNTAIFSLVNALALKPMPVTGPGGSRARVHRSKPDVVAHYEDIAARSTVFSDVAAHAGGTRTLTTDDNTARLSGETTSRNYLTMLGVPATLGRTYLPSDTRTDVVVLGERTWRTRFASDPSIVGRRILLGGRPFEIIGVMPSGFRGARPPAFLSDFWMPIDPALSERTLQDRGKTQFQLAARLKPGVTVAQAQAATQVIGQQLAREHPDLGERFAQTEVFHAEGINGFRGLTKTLLPLFASSEYARRLSRVSSCSSAARTSRTPARARRLPTPGNRCAPGAWCGPFTPDSSAADRKPAAGDPRRQRRHPLRLLDWRLVALAHQPAARTDRAGLLAGPAHVDVHADAVAPDGRALRSRASASRDADGRHSGPQRR